MRPAVVVASLPGVVVLLGGGACAPAFDGSTRLDSITPQVVATCDTDGVTLHHDVRFDPGAGEHKLVSVTVGAIDPSCAGSTLRLSVGDGDGAVLGTGSVVVTEAEVEVLFDPVVERTVDGETSLLGSWEVVADDVAIARIDVGD